MLNECFIEFGGKYNGAECILFGTGPSIKKYESMDGIKIGSNSIIHFKEMMDYYFIGDGGDKSRGYLKEPELYNNYVPKCGYKFIRATPPSHINPIPSGLPHSKYYSTTDLVTIPHKLKLHGFDFDITKKMYDTTSISFECLQFALFCGFKKINLVGHDCSYVHGTFETPNARNHHGSKLMLEMWVVWKQYIDYKYNDIEINVINPVSLRW